MTQAQMKAQIDAIDRVSKEALKSRESALQFLKDAGIPEILKPSFHTSRLPINRKKNK